LNNFEIVIMSTVHQVPNPNVIYNNTYITCKGFKYQGIPKNNIYESQQNN